MISVECLQESSCAGFGSVKSHGSVASKSHKGKMWAKIAEQRAEIRRLRKQIFRQSVASSKDEKFRAAVKVDNFALPLPQSEAQCIFSTKSIAAENMVQAERMCRASSIVVPERSGGSEAPCVLMNQSSSLRRP